MTLMKSGARVGICLVAALTLATGCRGESAPPASSDVTQVRSALLDATESVPVATGILNLWMHEPEEVASGPARRHTVHGEFDVESIESMPQVDVLYVHAGARPGLAQAALELGARGLVIAGSGAGSPGNLAKELADITAQGRAVVVQSSRVGAGRVVRNNNWSEPGMIAADNLPPHKAALLLSLALTLTQDTARIQRMFDEY
jgi:L-asparaginase